MVLGQEAADNGTCTVYVGGEERWFLRARPVLQTFGRDSGISGDVGSGQIAKMTNNMLLWTTMVANFEALTLAKQLGVDIPKLATALGHGSGANWSLSRWGKSTGNGPRRIWIPRWSWRRPQRFRRRLGGLVDQLVKGINQEKMRALLS